eukprot:ctg_351.g176
MDESGARAQARELCSWNGKHGEKLTGRRWTQRGSGEQFRHPYEVQREEVQRGSALLTHPAPLPYRSAYACTMHPAAARAGAPQCGYTRERSAWPVCIWHPRAVADSTPAACCAVVAAVARALPPAAPRPTAR